MKITLDIDDKFINQYSEHDLKMLAAVGLYEKGIMCTSDLAQAVGMSRADFILEMGKYGESILDMSEDEINRDIENAKQFFIS
jgi:predicted HTH domain antitoxin